MSITQETVRKVLTQDDSRAQVIAANDAYLEGRITRGQRADVLRLIAEASGYAANETGVACLITDLLDLR